MFSKRLLASLALRPHLQAVLVNTGWLVGDRLLRVLLGVVVGAWVARYLGPARYGELAYITALIAVFQIAVTLGADGIVVRDISQSPSLSGSILGSLLRIRLAAGVFGWAASCLVISALRPGDWYALGMVAMLGAGLVFQTADVVDLWFQSQTQSKRSVFAKAVGYLAAAAVKVALILFGAPLWCFAAALLLDAALAGLAMWLVYRTYPTDTAWTWDATQAKAMLKEAWPVLLSAIALVGYSRIDQLLLRELASEDELGLYSAVLPFSQAWHMLPMIVYASVLPRLATLRQRDEAAYWHRTQQIFSAMALMGLGAATLMAVFAAPLVHLLLGAGYAGSIPLLRIHALTNIFVFLNIAQSIVTLNDRVPQIALIKTALGLLLTVLLNLMFIPEWGATGAAWSAVVAQLFSGVVINAFIARGVFVMQLKAFWPGFAWRRAEPQG